MAVVPVVVAVVLAVDSPSTQVPVVGGRAQRSRGFLPVAEAEGPRQLWFDAPPVVAAVAVYQAVVEVEQQLAAAEAKALAINMTVGLERIRREEL